MSWANRLVKLLAVACLLGCVPPARPQQDKTFGPVFDEAVVQSFDENTTSSEILSALGQPVRTDKMIDGSVVWTYGYATTIGGGVKTRAAGLTLLDDKLLKYEIHLGDGPVGSGAMPKQRVVKWESQRFKDKMAALDSKKTGSISETKENRATLQAGSLPATSHEDLHLAKMSRWYKSTAEEKLEASARISRQFILVDNPGKEPSYVETMKKAVALQACISEAGKGGILDNSKISGVAAMCWVLMKGE